MPISMSGAGSYFKRDSFPTKGLILKSVVIRAIPFDFSGFE